jgi:Zn-finger nucleic acid-binding protein
MGPVAIGVCRDCGGVWLDQDRLAMLLEAGSSVLWKLWWKVHERASDGPPSARPACAQCAGALHPVAGAATYNLPVLTCACAGVWLSPNDLAELAARAAEAEMDPDWLREADGSAAVTEAQRIARAAIPVSTTCPDCGQPNSAESPLCWACGRRLTDLCAETACPNCDGVTRKVAAHDVEARACDFCGGVWLRDAALKSLLFLAPAEQRELAARLRETLRGREARLGAGQKCPDCAEGMAPIALGSFSRTPLVTCGGCSSRLVSLAQIEEMTGIAMVALAA